MGYNNPPVKWSELERRLSNRSRPGSDGGRPAAGDVLTGLVDRFVRVGAADSARASDFLIGRPSDACTIMREWRVSHFPAESARLRTLATASRGPTQPPDAGSRSIRW
jgi:hypothetical protein